MKAIDLGLLGEGYTQDSLGKGPYATPIRVQSPRGPELPALFMEPGGLQDKVYSNINILHLFSVLSDIPGPHCLPLLCVPRRSLDSCPSIKKDSALKPFSWLPWLPDKNEALWEATMSVPLSPVRGSLAFPGPWLGRMVFPLGLCEPMSFHPATVTSHCGLAQHRCSINL